MACAPHARDARGSFMESLGAALRRDVWRRGEGAAGGVKSTETRPSIAELEERIAALPPEARAAAERILGVSTTPSRLDPPAAVREWITKQFGSVDSVTTQRIVPVTNLLLLEGALFTDPR